LVHRPVFPTINAITPIKSPNTAGFVINLNYKTLLKYLLVAKHFLIST